MTTYNDDSELNPYEDDEDENEEGYAFGFERVAELPKIMKNVINT